MSNLKRAIDERSGVHIMLIEEICHRVLNEYTEAIASLTAAARDTPDAKGRQAMLRAADMLRDYAAAHHALRAPVAGALDLSSYLETLCGALAAARLSPRGVRLVLSAEAVELSSDRCWRVGLAVSELICNALRHGFTARTGQINVQLRRSNGRVLCRVRDNGAGFEAHVPGGGSRIVQRLAWDLGGSACWSGGRDGVCVDLAFPVAES